MHCRYCSEVSRLCDVVCDDGSRHRIRACIRGYILELNERLKGEPGLINTKTMTEGYIAVIQPKGGDEEAVCSSLLNNEQYKEKQAAKCADGGGGAAS